MLEAAAEHAEASGRPAGAIVVGSGDGVNVPPTVTAVVLTAGVIGGLFTVVTVLLCCRYCCTDTRRTSTGSLIKRFVYIW